MLWEVPESAERQSGSRSQRRTCNRGDWTLLTGGYKTQTRTSASLHGHVRCGSTSGIWRRRVGDWGRCWRDDGAVAAPGVGLAGCSPADRTGITEPRLSW